MMNRVVNGAVHWAVNRPVDLALAGRRAVHWAVGEAVIRAVHWAVNRAVVDAVAPHKEPPHPGLGIYLGGVP